ncbi:TPA: hypothetical protein ACOJPH_000504 [Vibrio campbellii]|uniref:acyltransferase n=1 Tax=Vibrio campbellii TaxID=680 RepID=UPI00390AC6D2
MLKKIIGSIIGYRFILLFVKFYTVFLKEKVKKAHGEVALSYIKNKGNDCRIHGKSTIYCGENINLGHGVRIGEGAFFHAMGGLEVGDNTQISRNVIIYTCNHDVNGEAIPYDDGYILKKVVIGESVWIGMGVMITPGVTIGDGAIIGMGAVISRDIKKGEVVVGSPQRVVGQRNIIRFDAMKRSRKLFSTTWPDK